MDLSRNPPLALPPKGTSAGLVAIVLLAATTPILSLMAASSWTPRGDALWLEYLPWAAALPLIVITVPPLLALYRRFWAVCGFWLLAALLAPAYPVALLFASLIPLGLVRQRSHEMFYTVVYPFGFLLALLPLYWFLVRFLRLPYFQPWADSSVRERRELPTNTFGKR